MDVPAHALRELILEELSRELPDVAVPESAGAELAALPLAASAAQWVDAVTRGVGAQALRSSGHAQAGDEVKALPPIHDEASARQAMMALERVGKRTQAPSALMRALGGVPSTLLLLGRARAQGEARQEAAMFQVVAAGIRVLGMAVRAGVRPDDAVRASLERLSDEST